MGGRFSYYSRDVNPATSPQYGHTTGSVLAISICAGFYWRSAAQIADCPGTAIKLSFTKRVYVRRERCMNDMIMTPRSYTTTERALLVYDIFFGSILPMLSSR